jgi:hypothetical protein
MVDTGAEYSWAPASRLASVGITPERVERFETADGRILVRDVGFAMLYAGERSAPTIVVFGIDGDMTLLGAFGLGGLSLRVDLVRRQLVPAGPVPAALVSSSVARRTSASAGRPGGRGSFAALRMTSPFIGPRVSPDP